VLVSDRRERTRAGSGFAATIADFCWSRSESASPTSEDARKKVRRHTDVGMTDDMCPDGGSRGRAYTIRLELVDEPGELLNALEPIAAHGGNLLSIFHERGSLTPRGHIPVEVALEATPGGFETIVDALRGAGVDVVQAGSERYSESLTVLLIGPLVDSDLSGTLSRLEARANASVTDVSLSAPEGTDGTSSARIRLATTEADRTLAVVRDAAAEKGLGVIEPLTPGADR
jgi:ACT domain-containing protein